MAKKKITAKNVVRFDGHQTQAPLTEEPSSALEQADKAIEQIEEAAARLEKKDVRKVSPKAAVTTSFSEDAEVFETEPLNLRTNSKYLDDEPQDPDWADEEDGFGDTDFEDDDEDGISTFAEVFIPLHTDSTGAIIRKGMVIVSLIVILCCLVALFMKRGAVGGVLTPDLSAWTAYADTVAAVLRFDG